MAAVMCGAQVTFIGTAQCTCKCEARLGCATASQAARPRNSGPGERGLSSLLTPRPESGLATPCLPWSLTAKPPCHVTNMRMCMSQDHKYNDRGLAAAMHASVRGKHGAGLVLIVQHRS